MCDPRSPCPSIRTARAAWLPGCAGAARTGRRRRGGKAWWPRLGEHAVAPADACGRMVGVAGDAALGVSGKQEGLVGRGARGGAPDIAARLAQALHGRQRDHGPGPLVAPWRRGRRRPSARPPAASMVGFEAHSLASAPGSTTPAHPTQPPPIRESWRCRRSRLTRTRPTRRTRWCASPRTRRSYPSSVSHTCATASAEPRPYRGAAPSICRSGARRCG